MNYAITYEEWIAFYKQMKKEFWQIIAVLFVFCIIILCGIVTVSQSFATSDTTEQVSTTDSDDMFAQAKAEYEQRTGRKIYPSGERCLRQAAIKRGCKTKDDYYILIDAEMKNVK